MKPPFQLQIHADLSETFDHPANARTWAAQMMASTDHTKLSEAGTIYKSLKEPVLAEACFWAIENEIDLHGTARLTDQIRIRFADWLTFKKRHEEALALLGKPAAEPFEHFRLQHLGKTYIQMKRWEDAKHALTLALELRTKMDASDHKIKSDLIQSTTFALEYIAQNSTSKRAIKVTPKNQVPASEHTKKPQQKPLLRLIKN